MNWLGRRSVNLSIAIAATLITFEICNSSYAATEVGTTLTVSTSASVDSTKPTHAAGVYQALFQINESETKLGGSILMSYKREYTHVLEDNGEGDWRDAVYSGSLGLPTFLGLDQFTFALKGSIPLSRESQRKDFVGSIGPTLTFGKTLGRWTLSEELIYRYAGYRYEVTDGEIHSPNSYRSYSSVVFKATDAWSFSGHFRWIHTVSFNGVGTSKSWTILATGYQFTPMWGIELGVDTLTGTVGPDGESDRISIVSEESSEIYLDLSMTF